MVYPKGLSPEIHILGNIKLEIKTKNIQDFYLKKHQRSYRAGDGHVQQNMLTVSKDSGYLTKQGHLLVSAYQVF